MCSLGSVPENVEYRRYAVQGMAVDGVAPLATMARLRSAVHAFASGDDSARLLLEFREDAQRRVRIEGRVVARVVLECQRCTQPFEHVMDAPVAGVVVADDDGAANVPKADEPIVAGGETLNLHTLAEDELLLALPMVARCDRPDCRTRYNRDSTVVESGAPAPRQDKDNPFSVLENIRHEQNKD